MDRRRLSLVPFAWRFASGSRAGNSLCSATRLYTGNTYLPVVPCMLPLPRLRVNTHVHIYINQIICIYIILAQ